MKNSLKQKLQSGQPVVGPFITADSPDIIEIFGLIGYDFAILDTEHGAGSIHSTQHLVRAAQVAGMAAIVRTTDDSPTTILRSLDIGTQGIHVPQINSAESARRLVQSARYFPQGERGVAMPRALGYGVFPLGEKMQEANEETLLIPHCESIQAVNNIEEILEVKGIDVLFVGPYDLSQSLGIPGQIGHPDMVRAIDTVLGAAKNAHKPLGFFCGTPEDAVARIQQGFQYIAYSMDTLILKAASQYALDFIRSEQA